MAFQRRSRPAQLWPSSTIRRWREPAGAAQGIAPARCRCRAAGRQTDILTGIRHWRHRAQNGGRIGAQRHGHRKRLAGMGQLMIAKIQRAAAMGQPAHDDAFCGRSPAGDRCPDSAAPCGPLGDRQTPGDQRCGIFGPAGLDRQLAEIDVSALPRRLPGKRAMKLPGRHVQDLRARKFIPGVPAAFRRFRFLEIGQQLPISRRAARPSSPMPRATRRGVPKRLA